MSQFIKYVNIRIYMIATILFPKFEDGVYRLR